MAAKFPHVDKIFPADDVAIIVYIEGEEDGGGGDEIEPPSDEENRAPLGPTATML